MALASSGWLLYVNNSNLLWQVMERSGRAPQVSGRLWLVLEGFRKLWGRFWAVLGVSGKLWRGSGWALARLWTALDGALEAALERIWKALDGFDGFGRGLDSSGRLWTALDGLESFGWQPGACSQLAECRKSCSHHWWGACFVKSIVCIAEACSLAKIINFK